MTRGQKGMLHGGLTLAAIGGIAALFLLVRAGKFEPEFPPVTPTPFDPELAGAVEGAVLYRKTPPKRAPIAMPGSPECRAQQVRPPLDESLLVRNGGLANAVVYAKIDGRVFDWKREPIEIDNDACQFRPRVAALRVRQPIRFRNSDPTVHNVHARDPDGGLLLNAALGSMGTARSVQIVKSGLPYTVRCDLHPWMVGFVAAFDHPFFTVTDADGKFRIEGLPEGEIELGVWHEILGERSIRVQVRRKATVTVRIDGAPE